MSLLDDEIQDIEKSLPYQRRNEFIQCVEKLKNPHKRHWNISDDSLSGVQRVDKDCKNCIDKSGKLQARIENCIEQLLDEYPRN